MAKKNMQKETIIEKLNLYLQQREEVENLINKYFELHQKLNGAIEATKDILDGLEGTEPPDKTVVEQNGD